MGECTKCSCEGLTCKEVLIDEPILIDSDDNMVSPEGCNDIDSQPQVTDEPILIDSDDNMVSPEGCNDIDSQLEAVDEVEKDETMDLLNNIKDSSDIFKLKTKLIDDQLKLLDEDRTMTDDSKSLIRNKLELGKECLEQSVSLNWFKQLDYTAMKKTCKKKQAHLLKQYKLAIEKMQKSDLNFGYAIQNLQIFPETITNIIPKEKEKYVKFIMVAIARFINEKKLQEYHLFITTFLNLARRAHKDDNSDEMKRFRSSILELIDIIMVA